MQTEEALDKKIETNGTPSSGLKLNVGAGQSVMDGYLNCDLTPGPNIDIVFDAQKEWPFENESVSNIYCSHTLEHLSDHIAFFKQAWRVMKPMGEMTIRVPYGHSSAAMSDITHLRPWFHGSFTCLQPGYNKCANGNHYNDDSFPYWVVDSFIVVPGWVGKITKWPFGNRVAWFLVNHLNNIGGELWVLLQKTVFQTMEGRNPNQVPCYLATWKSYLEGKPGKAGDMGTLIRLPVGIMDGWK